MSQCSSKVDICTIDISKIIYNISACKWRILSSSTVAMHLLSRKPYKKSEDYWFSEKYSLNRSEIIFLRILVVVQVKEIG